MAKRRPSGDGMVRKREDGRWEGRIVVGHKENGESIFRYVSAKSQKALMKKLDMNEKGFALLMNVAPSTVRLWTSGAAQPSGTARRLMQIYETGPEIVGKIAGGQPPADGGNL